MRVLDTFAGAGGFSLGFSQAGFEVAGALEIDQWACDTFDTNHPGVEAIRADISEVTESQLSRYLRGNSIDVLLGGPPCQGFSRCNTNAGDPKDPRNSLFQEFLRFARILQPKYVLMENVPWIARAKTAEGRLVVDIVREELEAAGYNVYVSILQAARYGVPQIRERLFVLGSTTTLDQPFPSETHTYVKGGIQQKALFEGLPLCPTVWDAISDLPHIEAREGAEVMEYADNPHNDYQKALRAGATELYNHKAMNHSKRVVARFESMKIGQSISDVAEEHRPRRRNGNGQLSGKAYDQNNRRMHPDRPCHTIPASFYANFVHPFIHRNFTPREGARLQSFPDTYRFLGKPTVVSQKLLSREGRTHEKHLCQYNQIGNAVPPLLARHLAAHIANAERADQRKDEEAA